MSVAEVIQFVNDWRSTKQINTPGPLTVDQLELFARELQIQIATLSIVPEGKTNAVFVAYSGSIGQLPAWQVAQTLSAIDDGLFYISDTEAGELLNSRFFRDAVIRAAGDRALGEALIDGKWTNDVRSPFPVSDVLAVA